jgi:hypothetical protein
MNEILEYRASALSGTIAPAMEQALAARVNPLKSVP